jgi:hypothetical protein
MARRGSVRVQKQLAVKVYGRDRQGHPFKQTAKVVELSRSGAKLAGIACVETPGDVVEIAYKGKHADFKVVWINDAKCEIGVSAIDPRRYIFGVSLPAGAGASPDSYSTPEAAAAVATAATDMNRTPAVWHKLNAAPQQQALGERKLRRYPRLRVLGGAEVRRGTERLWGRVTQINEGGCYVEALYPFPREAEVEVRLGANDTEIRARGIVRSSQPTSGMGIMFTEMAEDDLERLKTVIGEVSRGIQRSRFV